MHSGNSQLQQTFNQWDTDRSGTIDARELEQGLRSLGEPLEEGEAQSMIEMFDKDQSQRIDFNEFAGLYAYIQDMKKAFNDADTDRSRGLNMQQVQTALSKVHGPLIAAGGAILIFTMFKIFDKKKQGKLDWPNFLKMALHLGKLRTGFEHTPKFQESFNKPQQFGAPTQNFPPQQQGFMSQQQPPFNPQGPMPPQQSFTSQYPPSDPYQKRDVSSGANPFDDFLSFANSILGTDMRK